MGPIFGFLKFQSRVYSLYRVYRGGEAAKVFEENLCSNVVGGYANLCCGREGGDSDSSDCCSEQAARNKPSSRIKNRFFILLFFFDVRFPKYP